MSKEPPTARTRHRAPSVSSPLLPSHAAPAVRAGTQSGGTALDRHTQTRMSARFGHDFSQVRIHTDHRAEDSAEAFGAHAYTVGSDIVFGGGQYTPGSPQTERLLAHELTHVVQQSQSPALGGGDWGRASRKSDASEREADSVAAQNAMGRSVQVQAAPEAAVAREIDDVIDPAAPIPSPTPSWAGDPPKADDPPDVPDTPSTQEKAKPGGPTDWGDKGGTLTWDGTSPWPKSFSLDPGLGDPLQGSIPSAPPWAQSPLTPSPKPGGLGWGAPPPDASGGLSLPPLSGPIIGGIGQKPGNLGLRSLDGPTPAPPPGGGLLGQPLDPAHPYGDPHTWQPSPLPTPVY